MAELEDAAAASVEDWFDDAGARIVKIAGEVDISNTKRLGAVLEPMSSDPRLRVVFDLSELQFIDSSGLALLLAVAQRVESVALRSPSPVVRRIIEITGLGDVLPVEP